MWAIQPQEGFSKVLGWLYVSLIFGWVIVYFLLCVRFSLIVPKVVNLWAARSGYKILHLAPIRRLYPVDDFELTDSQVEIGRLPHVGKLQVLYHVIAMPLEDTPAERMLAEDIPDDLKLVEERGRLVLISPVTPAGARREGFLIVGIPHWPCLSASRCPVQVRWKRDEKDPMWDEALDR